jgi:hypothetical protein
MNVISWFAPNATPQQRARAEDVLILSLCVLSAWGWVRWMVMA